LGGRHLFGGFQGRRRTLVFVLLIVRGAGVMAWRGAVYMACLPALLAAQRAFHGLTLHPAQHRREGL